MLGSTTLHGWVESALYTQSQLEGGAAIVTMEREFRAAGMYNRLNLEIAMGQIGDYTYQPKVVEKGQPSSNKSAILDLLTMYPDGINVSQAARELGVGRKALSTAIDSLGDVEIIKLGQSNIIRMRKETRGKKNR